MKKTPILESLDPACSPAEESLFDHLFGLSCSGLDEDEEIVTAYILGNTPFGRLLLKRAKSLRPSLIVQGDAMEVGEILSTIDDAYMLGQMFMDEEFGRDPDVRHWKHCGGFAADSVFERLIEIAKRLERRRSLLKAERERLRVVRKCLEKEREMERYALQRASS